MIVRTTHPKLRKVGTRYEAYYRTKYHEYIYGLDDNVLTIDGVECKEHPKFVDIGKLEGFCDVAEAENKKLL